MRAPYIFVCFVFIHLNLTFVAAESPSSTAEIEAKVRQILETYLKRLAKESKLDFSVILSRESHYDDGQIKQIDTAAFTSKVENATVPNDCDLSTISKKNMRKIVSDAEDKEVHVEFTQDKVHEDTKNSTNFGLDEVELPYSGAAYVVLHDEGFANGLQSLMDDTMDKTDNVAIIQMIESFQSGGVKRNVTMTVHSSKVTVLGSYKMSARMVQEAAETLKKAYKVDIDNRTPIIAALFDHKFPKYKWQVVENSAHYLLKKDTMVNLVVGKDNYHIIGTKD